MLHHSKKHIFAMKVKGIWQVLKKAGHGFVQDKVPKLSASLAYYTVFSLGPMLLVIIFLANLFWGQQAIEGLIVGQLQTLVGSQVAFQVQEIIRNASVDSGSTIAAIAGIVTLFIGATTVFSEIQDSINFIWHLKRKKNAGWWKMLLTRIKSFSIVVSLGFLLLVSLLINALLEILMGRLQSIFPQATVTLVYIVNLVVTLLVTTFLFGMIYKILPDAFIRWRDVYTGAVFTAILFMLAKFGITFYIGKSDIGSTYGAAGSLVVLLLWIYFSSMILYFGAEFTKFYALKYGTQIRPNSLAVTFRMLQEETANKSIQENEKNFEVLQPSERQK
jgi:membrane protein